MKLRNLRGHLAKPSEKRKKQQGIAIFMVMSTLAVLTVVVAELTYSTHIQQRLAYNYVDGLKAFYMAKAGFKLSLLRLRVYSQVKEFLGDQKNKAIAGMVDAAIIEKIWSFPFVFPMPVPDGALPSQSDAIKEFNTKSTLPGSFQIQIVSESSRMNINNLLVTTRAPGPSPSASAGARPNPNPSASAAGDVDFKPLLEDTFNSLLARKRDSDREFAETYRNTTGKDILDAILVYIQQNQANPVRPNLPGAEKIIPKNAPLYSLSELHFINGLDDTLFDLISPTLTTFSTPGVNINTASKSVIWSLIPQMTEEEINELMKSRDDPDEGKLFQDEEKFWEAVKKTSASSKIDTIKENLSKAGVRLITTEKAFKIVVNGIVGLSTRTLEAYVILGPENKTNQPGAQPSPGTGQVPPPANQPNNRQGAQNPSANNAEGLHLVYWRVF